MSSSGETPDPEAARVLSKVRRLMAISLLFTGLAIAAVLVVIGYRVSRIDPRTAPAEATATLPPGARVVATTLSADRLALTVEAGGTTEIHLFDLQTLVPRGRLRLTPQQ
jgi:hypothetical protein